MEDAAAMNGDSTAFQQLLRSVRAGDNAARERLYLDYGPYFRRVIRRRLKEFRIEWATTPHDIFDAVVLRVWQEDALNSLSCEVEFLKYVSRAVEREVSDVRRNLTAGRRDYRRMEVLDDRVSSFVAKDTDPVRRASLNEELEKIRSGLSAQDRQVLEMWLAGKGWACIGAQFGLGMEVIRKRFRRSLAALRAMVIQS